MYNVLYQQADGLWGPSHSMLVALLLALLIAGLLLLLVRRRYRLRQSDILERVSELETLNAAGRALVESRLDVEALCELIAREAGKIIDTDTFQVGLFTGDRGNATGRYEIVYWRVQGRRREGTTFDLGDDGGLVGWVRDRRQPLLVQDFERELARLPAQPRYVSESPPRSGVFIPLISGEQTLGLMAAQSNDVADFSQDDLRRLSILANQAGSAIANARLFEEERTRAAHLELVGQIAQQVNAIQNLDELFNQVVALTRQTFGFHPVSIFGIEEHTGQAVLQASSLQGIKPGHLRIPPQTGLVGVASAGRRTIVSNDVEKDERFVRHLGQHDQLATRAEMAIPLIVDEQLLGVLDVQSETPGVFLNPEQTVLEALAAQVAIAIHKTRQLAAQREQAWVTTAQLQVADAIRQNSGMDDLLASITRLTPLLVGVEHCAILLRQPDLEVYEGKAVYGLEPKQTRAFEEAQLAIGQWNALDAVHVGMARLATKKAPPWMEEHGDTVSLVLYPLIAKGHMVGIMIVDEPARPPQTMAGIFSESYFERQDELLRNVANQTAQAIESEQLHVAQQEEAWVNTALLQVAEAVNRLIDLNDILNTIVRFIPMLVGVESCIILIWDDEAGTFHAGPSYGLDEMGRGLMQSLEIDGAELPTWEAQSTSAAGLATTVTKIHLPTWLQDVMGAPTANALPLYARSSLVGALVVGPSVNDRPLIGRRLSILTGIAQQAATAVVNDQLYKEAAERNRLEQELDVARQIQASFIPPGNPQIPRCSVASFWQAARQVSGDFYDFLALPGHKWGIVVADVADKGVPAALFMALSRTIIRTIAFGRYEAATALERANRIIWNDTTSDLFVTAFYAIWDPATSTLSYGNAGHNPPLLICSDGEIKLLQGEGMAMGVLEEIRVAQKYLHVDPGDTVIFYTDGVTEAMNEDMDEFGLERLRLAATGASKGNAAAIMKAITAAIGDHAGDAAQFDDVTVVVMKCHE